MGVEVSWECFFRSTLVSVSAADARYFVAPCPGLDADIILSAVFCYNGFSVK